MRNKNWKQEGAFVVILGAGESGVGTALLAQQRGYNVFVSDKGKINDAYKEELITHQIPFEEGTHTIEKIKQANVIVKSPGIPDTIPLIKALNQEGIPVISEIEFAAKHTTSKIIGITGSNGKTTTTTLTYHLLENAGLPVAIGGNIGRSFARLLAEMPQNGVAIQKDYFVLELSSFQLDGIVDFRPHIAILLNITPDHLDRYDYKMENYVQAKMRLIKNQLADDIFIYNAQDDNICQALYGLQQRQPIDANTISDKGIAYDHGNFINLEDFSLKGIHNYFNAACAIEVCKALKLPVDKVQQGIDTFVNVPHRLELVATIKDVDYINDSKATNVDAVFYALQAMDKPTIWIAGGTDKGNDYTAILSLVEEKVKALICLGIDNQKLIEVFSPIIKNIEETRSATDAALRASIYAEKGDAVLLSPACASFDLFDNYIDRGNKFKVAVQQLDMAK